MKAFKLISPAYKSNGFKGAYYSVAITDDKGNVLKGFGDHISDNSYGIKNVFESQGTSFSDEDRFISIEEIIMDEEKFDSWLNSYNENQLAWKNRSEEEERLFGVDPYNYVYSKKEGQSERLALREKWKIENPIPQFKYYSFLELIEDEN